MKAVKIVKAIDSLCLMMTEIILPILMVELGPLLILMMIGGIEIE